nr:hypothetical protein Iba_chr11eCG14330 [Ipomoea batatas]GME21087.1 hypothetical protein Iba_scaffold26745CG0010 [Ipomoea batatas]
MPITFLNAVTSSPISLAPELVHEEENRVHGFPTSSGCGMEKPDSVVHGDRDDPLYYLGGKPGEKPSKQYKSRRVIVTNQTRNPAANGIKILFQETGGESEPVDGKFGPENIIGSQMFLNKRLHHDPRRLRDHNPLLVRAENPPSFHVNIVQRSDRGPEHEQQGETEKTGGLEGDQHEVGEGVWALQESAF